jgi:hypothetical protein
MRIAERRATRGCLAPVVIDSVLDDPETIRVIARENCPYFHENMPPGVVWPLWSAPWAADGKALFDAAEPLLQHDAFIAAAAEMCGSDRVIPSDIYINLSTPSRAQPVTHTDSPDFEGIDRKDVPAWFRLVMGVSGLFEAERITTVTAVSWFFAGGNGFYRYWPEGRDEESIQHRAMWNTAVVGDNTFMHHQVERTGPEEMGPPKDMTVAAHLDRDGDDWLIVEDGLTLAHYSDEHVRLSMTWTAKVFDEDSGTDQIDLDEIHSRMADAMSNDFAASSASELFSDAARKQLVPRWPGFLPD